MRHNNPPLPVNSIQPTGRPANSTEPCRGITVTTKTIVSGPSWLVKWIAWAVIVAGVAGILWGLIKLSDRFLPPNWPNGRNASAAAPVQTDDTVSPRRQPTTTRAR
jgi:hypothetical protein